MSSICYESRFRKKCHTLIFALSGKRSRTMLSVINIVIHIGFPKVRSLWIPTKYWHQYGYINKSPGLLLVSLGHKKTNQCVTSDCKITKKLIMPSFIFLIVRSKPTQKTHYNICFIKTKTKM